MIVVRHDFPTMDYCCTELASHLTASARRRVAEAGKFTLVLAGGSTPKQLYQLLAAPPFADTFPWSQTHFFWGDERCVPPGHPHSNYRMAQETLFNQLPVPPANIHRMAGDMDPATAALAYEGLLRSFFAPGACSIESADFPCFDLILLGLGPDGHTASLFPDSPALAEQTRWVVATPPPPLEPRVPRLTLTLPVLNHAASVVFLISGPEKKTLADAILAGQEAAELPPAARVRPCDEVHWYVSEQET